MKKEVWQIDAFTTEPLCGNPAAVVFDAGGLSAGRMQAISREMNLSETAFIVSGGHSPEGYDVRFFTPRREVPFGGHPTLAAAFAVATREQWLVEGRPLTIVQRCGIGDVPVEVSWLSEGPLFNMRQGPPEIRVVDLDRDDAAELLGCRQEGLIDAPFASVSTGLPWLVLPLRSREVLDSLSPDLPRIESLAGREGAAGVTVFSFEAGEAGHRVAVRTFAPGHGVPEDPVCGSGNGSVAAYVGRFVLADPDGFSFVAEQGSHVGRPGQVFVSWSRTDHGSPTIRVAGHAVRVLMGWLEL